MQQEKMNRGSQKGSQNARTHGFCASSLTLDKPCFFLTILEHENLACPRLSQIHRQRGAAAGFRYFTRPLQIPGLFTVIFTTPISLVYSGSINGFTLEKWQSMLFNVLQNKAGVFFPVLSRKNAGFSFGKGVNN